MQRLFHNEGEMSFLETDRPAFEQWLAEPIRDHLRMQNPIRSIQRRSRGFTVAAGNIESECEAVILCCGADYRFQRKLGLLHHAPTVGYAFGERQVAEVSLSKSSFTWEIVGSCEGYGWAFPKDCNEWNIGVLGYHAAKIRSEFSQFKRRFGFDQSGRSHFGGRFPCGGLIPKIMDDGLLVCGDAAGMVFAGTGEGIRMALLSGDFAAQVMADAVHKGDVRKRRLRAYHELCYERFGRELNAGVWTKDLLLLLDRLGMLGLMMESVPDQRVFELMLGRVGLQAKSVYCLLRAWERLYSTLR